MDLSEVGSENVEVGSEVLERVNVDRLDLLSPLIFTTCRLVGVSKARNLGYKKGNPVVVQVSRLLGNRMEDG